MLLKLFLGLFLLFAAFLVNLKVVVQDGGDDRDHIGFNHSRPYVLGSTNADVDDALKCQVPLPHVHHILAPALLQDADQPLDATIDGKNVSYACRRCCQVGKVVEGVDEREGRGTIESTTIVKRGGDTHRRLVDVRDAEVDLPHFEG